VTPVFNAKRITNVGELRRALDPTAAPLPYDDRPIDVWYQDVGRSLVYVGVSGENTDISFKIYDSAEEADLAIASGNAG
jgi:hypothetical protein